jgi:hypothetical protein
VEVVVLTFVSATLPPAPSSFEHLLVVPLGVGVDNRTGVIPREKLFILLRFSHVKNL